MSTSLPSNEICTVDIPEVKGFRAKFHYNFFVPNEKTDDTGGVPTQFLSRNSGDIDAKFIQNSLTRVPRFVEFEFIPPKLSTAGRIVTDNDIRNNSNAQTRQPVIARNLDKIISEEDFASKRYTSINFHDGETYDKIHELVSGSVDQYMRGQPIDRNTSAYKSVKNLGSFLPDIKQRFLSKFGSDMQGVSFSAKGSREKLKTNVSNNKTPGRGQSLILKHEWKDRLNDVKVHVQINSKLLNDVIERQVFDPNTTHGDSLLSLHSYSKNVQEEAVMNSNIFPSEGDYKTSIPFIGIDVNQASHVSNRDSVEAVGFVIDKTEITPSGDYIKHDSIVIENPSSHRSVDYRVRYGSTYKYEIRTIVQFTLPAIDSDSGSVASLKVLVSSKPSNTLYIVCLEQEAPPPPCDLGFTWDYETNKLVVRWSFPPNPQRDIKKFQVFRRKDIDEPFELVKMYDFDDSELRVENIEEPSPTLVEYTKSPVLSWIDDDFDKTNQNQTFIYAVACLDAHGLTSNYSAQFEIGFDIFSNKLTKKLVSHTGAPKPYPNLYLNRDLFIDTMKVNGPHSKSMKVIFNPEYYYTFDDSEKVTPVIATTQSGGSYKIQIINLDNQKSEQVTINIDDRTSVSGDKNLFTKVVS